MIHAIAMATELIQLTEQQSIVASVVQRIENRNTFDRQRDWNHAFQTWLGESMRLLREAEEQHENQHAAKASWRPRSPRRLDHHARPRFCRKRVSDLGRPRRLMGRLSHEELPNEAPMHW